MGRTSLDPMHGQHVTQLWFMGAEESQTKWATKVILKNNFQEETT